jgi:hypothetical protein
MKSEYFATIQNGKIALLGVSSPEHELTEDQIPLTAEEFHFLKAVRGKLSRAKRIIKAVENKVKGE